MARLKIAFVYDALYPYVIGGAERRYYELARRLALDHEVHFYSWTYWSAGDSRLNPDVHHHGVGSPPRFYANDGKRRISEALAFALRLTPQLARARFDVIDCASMPYLPTLSAQACARMTGTPLLVTWHEYWGPYWRSYLPRLASAAAAIERLSTLAGDIHVAVSSLTASRLRASSLRHVPTVVVPNGVDLDVLQAASPALKSGEVVFLGRLIREKRVDLLLRALALLRPKHKDLRCTIVGDGPMRPELERLASELGLQDSVAFTGFLEERAALETLRASGVCVLPSEREGFGMVVAESQAIGVPVIVTRSPESAATDLVEDGVTGLICEADPGSLAAALDTVHSSSALRKRITENGRKTSLSYGWDRAAETMETIYWAAARREGYGNILQSLSRHGAGEQTPHPVTVGAPPGRHAPGPRL